MTDVRRQPLDRLFMAESIAIVGASGRPQSRFSRPLHYLIESGFEGAIYPVNPRHAELMGYKCYSSLIDIPGTVDLVCLMVPADQVLAVIKECAAIQAGAAIVFSSGFSETGPEGRILERQVVAAANAAGVRLLGPNCVGAMYLTSGVVATFSGALAGGSPLRGDLAYVGQSGAVGGSVLQLAREIGLGLDAWVSTGNEADLTTLEVARWLLARSESRVLLLYVENLRSGIESRFFLREAREAGKHVILLRAGRSLAGRAAANSHTGAMLSPGIEFDLIAKAEGAVVVDDVPDLVSAAVAVQSPGECHGLDVGIVSSSGGVAILAADFCQEFGLRVPPFPDSVKQLLKAELPKFASAENPADLTASMFTSKEHVEGGSLRRALVAAAEPVDLLFIGLTNVGGDIGTATAREVVQAQQESNTVFVVCWLASRDLAGDAFDVLRDSQISGHRSVREAVRVMSIIAATSTFVPPTVRSEPSQLASLAVDLVRFPVMTEVEAEGLLESLDIPYPPGALVQNLADLEGIAETIPGPYALKAQSPHLPHKTDAGGVRLNVLQGEMEDAYKEIVSNVSQFLKPAEFDGTVLIQSMAVIGGQEMILSGRRRSEFPPLLTVGFGGVGTEIYQDISSALAPIDHAAAVDMIRRLKGAPLLFGYRGSPSLDTDSLARAISNLSYFLDSLPPVGSLEVEINPIVVNRSGVVALDFWLEGEPLGERTSHHQSRSIGPS